MPVALTPSRRRALGTLVLLAALVLGWMLGAGPAGAAGSPARPALQADPTPSTAPLGEDEQAPAVDAPAPPAGDVEGAREVAEGDLRSVWVVVAALVVVAIGLLVLLVLYVRSTRPDRAAARTEERRARLAERQAARGEDEGGAAEAQDDTASAPAAAASARPSRSGDPRPAPSPSAGGTGLPARPQAGPGLPARPKPVLDTKAPPASVAPVAAAVLSRAPTPEDADAQVRIIAADGPDPSASQGSPPGGSSPVEGPDEARPPAASLGAQPAAPFDQDESRPPPRSLLATPTPRRRPRRVEAPAKKLGTPDAERVLLRPGRPPVRVPPAQARDRADAGNGSPAGDDAEAASAPAARPGGDGASPPAPGSGEGPDR